MIKSIYENDDQCCGCSACFAICPASAISMIEDKEGFLYPQINTEKCVECNLCRQVCPLKLEMI